MRLLLVEDNPALADWLAKSLRQSAYVVDTVRDGEDADHALTVTGYDLVVLDLALPKMGGLAVLRRLRGRGQDVPVIILTANASLDGRIAGLDQGADDYLAKPFEVTELEARIRAQLRRASQKTAPVIAFGDVSFDTNTRLFSLGSEPMALTPKEHALFEQLLRKSGTTVSKAELLRALYGFDDDADENAIEIHVHRLRRKLDGANVRIVTLRGLGYLLRADAPRP